MIFGMWVHDHKAVCRVSKVIMVRDTQPYGHAPTYQISLTYLERQKCYGRKRKYYLIFLLDLEVKGQGA
jgi:hypothetical protein